MDWGFRKTFIFLENFHFFNTSTSHNLTHHWFVWLGNVFCPNKLHILLPPNASNINTRQEVSESFKKNLRIFSANSNDSLKANGESRYHFNLFIKLYLRRSCNYILKKNVLYVQHFLHYFHWTWRLISREFIS